MNNQNEPDVPSQSHNSPLPSVSRYKGRQEDVERNEAIMSMLERGDSWNHIIAATGCSRSTLSRLTKRLKGDVAA